MKFKVSLCRTTIDSCEVMVEAKSEREARQLARDRDHDWQHQETMDINVNDCKVIDDDRSLS